MWKQATRQQARLPQVILAQTNPDTLQVRGDQSVQGRVLTVHYLRSGDDLQV